MIEPSLPRKVGLTNIITIEQQSQDIQKSKKLNNTIYEQDTKIKPQQIANKPTEQPNNLPTFDQVEYQFETKSKLNGITFIILQVGLMVCYGFSGFYYLEQEPSKLTYNEVISIIMLGLFAILGFGLVLSVFRCASWLGVVTSILVFAIFVQLSPILQSLFFNSFVDSFVTTNVYPNTIYKGFTDNQASSRLFIQHYRRGLIDKIKLSGYSFRVTFLSIISFLTFMTAIVGRLTFMQTLKTAIIFQILWSLNFIILIYYAIVRTNTYWHVITPFAFDTYGSSYIFLFAVFFGLPFTIIINNIIPKINHERNLIYGSSWLMSTIGTALIFSTFVFSYNNLIVYYNNEGKFYGENFKYMHIIFALLGSVVSTYAGSMLVNKGRVSFKQSLIGTISGGVSVGSAAPFIPSIGIAILIGSSCGFISGLITKKIHSKINKKYQYDALGLFGPFFVSALIGSIVVPTVVLAYYYNTGKQQQNTVGLPYAIDNSKTKILYSKQLISYQLIYAGLSTALGLAGGIIAGLLCRWDKDNFGLLSNGRFFYNDFGLFSIQVQQPKIGEKKNQVLKPKQQGNKQNQNNNASNSIILINPQ